MKICIKIARLVLDIIYSILKCFPTREKVVFISRQHDTSNADFDLMIAYMREMHPEYECKVLAKRIKPGIGNSIRYGLHVLCQMYELATSKIVILDTYCIPVSLLKHKESLVVIQIWHAIGAFKKFGYSVVGKEEGSSAKMAESMCMHKNYDYVCASSEYCVPYFAEAFAVPENMVKVFPLPRLDRLLEEERKEIIKQNIYRKYPMLKDAGKKIILYAPTFRKEEGVLKQPIQNLLKAIDFNEFECVIKLHPLSCENINSENAIMDVEFSTADMMLVADIIITDYSAIVFEAAVLRKPIYFYGFDYVTYMDKRDFYLDYQKEIPGELYVEAKDLVSAIRCEEVDLNVVGEFANKYVEERCNSYTANLCEFILQESERKCK